MKRGERDQKERITKLGFWKPHVLSWAESTKPATQYCRENNLNQSTFKYWQYIILGKSQIRKHKPPSFSKPMFLEVSPVIEESSSKATTVTIQTPKGYKIHLECQSLEKDLATILKLSE